MTDKEAADVLRRSMSWWVLPEERVAILRAIEILEWMQQYEADLAKFGPGGEWS